MPPKLNLGEPRPDIHRGGNPVFTHPCPVRKVIIGVPGIVSQRLIRLWWKPRLRSPSPPTPKTFRAARIRTGAKSSRRTRATATLQPGKLVWGQVLPVYYTPATFLTGRTRVLPVYPDVKSGLRLHYSNLESSVGTTPRLSTSQNTSS